MRVRAILNPRAGLKARRAARALEDGPGSWSIELVTTRGPAHAQDLAHEAAARGDDLVLAVGGDGTINEVATGILGSGTALGIVPAGSGNGLARTLGIPLNPGGALARLADGLRRRMDVGRINGRVFLNVAGTGFDASIATAFHDWGLNGGRRGVLPYVWLAMREVRRIRPDVRALQADGLSVEMPMLLAAFANGRQYGGGAIIAPAARLDDGRIDVVVIEACPMVRAWLSAPRLFLGTIGGFPYYRHWQVSSATLVASVPHVHHRDGEPGCEAARFEVAVEPRALEVLVPRATVEAPDGPFCERPAGGRRVEG